MRLLLLDVRRRSCTLVVRPHGAVLSLSCPAVALQEDEKKLKEAREKLKGKK
jgi:hypothetical protein